MHYIRLDISYAICRLARYTEYLSVDHWKSIERAFSYLKRTKSLELFYNKFPAVLECYSDASWFTRASDKNSITGWIITLGSVIISWSSKKHMVTAHFTMET